MATYSTELHAFELAEFLDQTLRDEWEPSVGALARLAPGPDGAPDVEFRSFHGHPSEALPEMPHRPGCVAVCLSVLGYLRPLDKPGARRRRIRSTVGVDATGDISLIRYKDGTVERMHRVEGSMADLLYSMLDPRPKLADVIPLRPPAGGAPERVS
jgi:hypothetical protein